MTTKQWEQLKAVVKGEIVSPAPCGFIIDCPWLPNWYGVTILDYFSSEEIWLKANQKVIETFPDIIFLPGFWSEFGMCTEPSAFGSRCVFPSNEFPHAHKVIHSADDIEDLPQPDPRTDGLLPFMLNRLKHSVDILAEKDQAIHFALARGPLNIASYLMGSTEFLTTMMMMPDKAHALLEKITIFLQDWISLQRESIPSINSIFLLDDIIGFLGEAEFKEFALPYFKRLYTDDFEIRFLHNDAPCRVSAPFLHEMNVNLFNPGFDVPLAELRKLLGPEVCILGNIPPRDVLAAGTAAEVAAAARELVAAVPDRSRIIYSCGGGMPPGVSTENLNAFVSAIRESSKQDRIY